MLSTVRRLPCRYIHDQNLQSLFMIRVCIEYSLQFTTEYFLLLSSIFMYYRLSSSFALCCFAFRTLHTSHPITFEWKNSLYIYYRSSSSFALCRSVFRTLHFSHHIRMKTSVSATSPCIRSATK